MEGKARAEIGELVEAGAVAVTDDGLPVMDSGLMRLAYCLPDDLRIDFLHVDNAVQAHVKAVELLLRDEDEGEVSGQAFYVTDGRPISLAQFLEPLHRALTGGRPLAPRVRLPPSLVVVYARVFQAAARLVAGATGRPPRMPFWALTPMEAYKVC